MSKMSDAMSRAEEERRTAQAEGAEGAKFSGYFQALKQELQDEIRWVEEAVRRREPLISQAAAAPDAVVRAQAPAGPNAEAALVITRAVPMAAPQPAPAVAPVQQTQVEAVKIQPKANLSPASWDQAIALVKDQLQTCEQQAARQAGDQVRFRAQLDALEQLVTQLQQERDALRQKLELTSRSNAALDATKSSLSRQLDALRECQILAYDVRMADQECQASAAVVAHVSQSNQRMANELSHYQDRTNALQHQAQQLKFRLAQAMASASTAPAAAPHLNRPTQPATESSS